MVLANYFLAILQELGKEQTALIADKSLLYNRLHSLKSELEKLL